MNFRIEQIEYQNIRDIGDLILDFTKPGDGEAQPISLVQMPNGTGKTTTMGLLRTVILGAQLDADEVQSYEPETGASLGKFSVAFSSDGERYKNHLRLDYDIGRAEYEHSRVSREGGGLNDGHFVPNELEKLLSEEMVDLFVFNGELTEEFIQTDEGIAEQALKTVTRLDRIEATQNAIERVREEHQESREGAKTEQGLKGYRTKLNDRKERLDELRAKKSEITNRLKEVTEKISTKQSEREQLIRQHGEAIEEFKRLTSKIEEAKNELKDLAIEFRAEMRVPSRIDDVFDEAFEELLVKMDEVQLPRATSADFFESLAQQDVCVCGRAFDEHSRSHLLDSKDDYLSNQDVGVLNALKERLKDPETPVDTESELSEIEAKRRSLQTLQTQLDQLEIGDEGVEEKSDKLLKEIGELKTKKKRLKSKLEYLTETDSQEQEMLGVDWQTNIPLAEDAVEKYEQKLAKATGTVQFKRKSEKANEIFKDFVNRSVENEKSWQIENSNARLDKILSRSSVQIESIEDSIKLKNRDGASEGQSLAVAYAYLSSLFEDSSVDIPFVIDSPAVSLDHKVRAEVAPIITDLFDQVIAFVISTEKDGFVENMSPGEGEELNYYTVYKTGDRGEVDVHTDRDFFMEFESEEALPASGSAVSPQD
jgi:seryl-tRNA synthetase